MNAATILGSLRALRPAAATVLILAVVAGLVQNVGRAPNPSIRLINVCAETCRSGRIEMP